MEVVREFDSVPAAVDDNRRGAQLRKPVEFGRNAKVASVSGDRIDCDARDKFKRAVSSERVGVESRRDDQVADRVDRKSVVGNDDRQLGSEANGVRKFSGARGGVYQTDCAFSGGE